MAQPAVSNSWDSSVIPEIPSINPSFSHLVTNDHGNVDSSGSLNMQNATNHNVLSAQAANPSPHIPHGLPDAASGLYIPGSQMFGASTTDSSPSLSRAYEQFTTLPSQYLNGNDISPSTQYQFTGSANVTNLEQNQYGNNGHRWSENSHVGFQNPSAATGQALPPVISPNIYYQSVFPHQVQGLQHYVPYQNMVQVPQISNTQPATAGPTRLDAPAVPSLNRQTSFRPRQYGQFPQAGVSPTSTSIHHRRQHRNHSITSSAPPVQQQHTRSNSQNLYVRARPMRDSNSLNVPSPQIQRSHSAVTAVPQVLPTAGGEAHYPPPLTQQEQIELARRLHMREMLRSARSSEHHRLHLYEEDYLRHHRRQQEEAASHCKGLDDQKDGRPEPKDDEELNVNLECKICMSQLVDTVLIPCGHAILCRWCAEQHSRSDRMRPKASVVCPLCRAPVKQKLRIYLS
ncbi:hypothetical protein BDV23DRAFT_168093 [Aspergillus alliaceus]|uniref:Uncharacterized protein n=1 Tax=Petromyces alliaceus TaxID=209559 RepID=A0A5N7CQ41_PETAA|nr:uncharacterized protein BDW43DRAFT_19200 [Aspergillus alliaceus]KAB8236047.1 hypothetical protein BDW43DRAFT_19200 [Aspergillus alliaceus]KAE8396244.1 hypothetical protein BDV23DRAFT_168093 [Aspergillus alliaceus]